MGQTISQEEENTSEKMVVAPATYRVKRCTFDGRQVPFLCQDTNGPCPLLALANALLLKGSISLPDEWAVCTAGQIVEKVVQLMDNRVTRCINRSPAELAAVLEAKDDVFKAFQNIHEGLDLNVKFDDIRSFEFTPQLSVFDMFGVDLCHAFVADEKDYPGVAPQSFNSLVERATTDELSIEAKFYEDHPFQVTYAGLGSLHAGTEEGNVYVLFRANHFHVLVKRRGQLFTLVTDVGYVDRSGVVWETLADVSCNSVYCNADFKQSVFYDAPAVAPGVPADENENPAFQASPPSSDALAPFTPWEPVEAPREAVEEEVAVITPEEETPRPRRVIRLSFRFGSPRTFKVKVDSDGTVGSMKAKLTNPKLAGVPENKLRLVCDGEELQDSANIYDVHEVHVYIRQEENTPQKEKDSPHGEDTPLDEEERSLEEKDEVAATSPSGEEGLLNTEKQVIAGFPIKAACNGKLSRFRLYDLEFETLLEHVGNIFGTTIVAISYRDDEGDVLPIARSTELAAAFDCVEPGSALRISVDIKQ